MGWFLFIDESGQDGRNSPYEVLAGVAIEDRKLWQTIQLLKMLQESLFGVRLFDAYGVEAKGQKLLWQKTFKHANQKAAIDPVLCKPLAFAALTNGAAVAGDQLTALGQAKLSYVGEALRVCGQQGAVGFASIIPNDIARPATNFLRKDYAFLFERFHHFLNNRPIHHPDDAKPMGTIVFDEIEKRQSQILMDQMEGYFLHTRNGKIRSKLIIPEPFFVHSDLTTMVQMTDLVAYIISWGVRLKGGAKPMVRPARPELAQFAGQVCRLRYHAKTPGGHDTWGFKVIDNLLLNAAN